MRGVQCVPVLTQNRANTISPLTFSSVQDSIYSLGMVCDPQFLSEYSPVLLLRQFWCWSDWGRLCLVFSKQIADLCFSVCHWFLPGSRWCDVPGFVPKAMPEVPQHFYSLRRTWYMTDAFVFCLFVAVFVFVCLFVVVLGGCTNLSICSAIDLDFRMIRTVALKGFHISPKLNKLASMTTLEWRLHFSDPIGPAHIYLAYLKPIHFHPPQTHFCHFRLVCIHLTLVFFYFRLTLSDFRLVFIHFRHILIHFRFI